MRLPLSLQTLRIENRLNRRNNHLVSFAPVNLRKLSYLTNLHITYTWLSDTNLLQIQTCAALSRGRDGVGITHLSLVNCGLRIAPKWISENIGLKHLDLSRNNINEFPEEYERLTNLHTLSIGNDIKSKDISASIFPSFIYALPRLECLNIGGFFQDIPLLGLGDPHFLANCNMQLARLTHLTSLDISGNRFRLVRCCFPTALLVSSSLLCMLVCIRSTLL